MIQRTRKYILNSILMNSIAWASSPHSRDISITPRPLKSAYQSGIMKGLSSHAFVGAAPPSCPGYREASNPQTSWTLGSCSASQSLKLAKHTLSHLPVTRSVPGSFDCNKGHQSPFHWFHWPVLKPCPAWMAASPKTASICRSNSGYILAYHAHTKIWLPCSVISPTLSASLWT